MAALMGFAAVAWVCMMRWPCCHHGHEPQRKFIMHAQSVVVMSLMQCMQPKVLDYDGFRIAGGTSRASS